MTIQKSKSPFHQCAAFVCPGNAHFFVVYVTICFFIKNLTTPQSNEMHPFAVMAMEQPLDKETTMLITYTHTQSLIQIITGE